MELPVATITSKAISCQPHILELEKHNVRQRDQRNEVLFFTCTHIESYRLLNS